MKNVYFFQKKTLSFHLYLTAMFFIALFSSGCKIMKTGDKPNTSEPKPDIISEVRPSSSVQWKRVNAIKNDLAYALDLTEDELCTELGTLSCFDQVHLSSLGGNEPFMLTQYEPVGTPNAISAVAAERVALAACSNKVDIDAGTKATVFTEYDLSSMSAPNDATYLSALDKQNTKLYQRLLVRDPAPAELTLLQSLSKDNEGNPISNTDVAKLSCFTIATSSEFIFL